MSDKKDEPQEQQDKTFTTQFSNNIPERLDCVDVSAPYIKCVPQKMTIVFWSSHRVMKNN